ncbi:AMP-binding protein, partial [Ramlibacter sp.]|uniref:AMP-binding protein n=1 Tax=Ramlibacter sp. TaxID=1917967 RepID=UPI001821EE61
MDAELSRPSLGRDLQRAFAEHGWRVAIECAGRCMTYAELGEAVRCTAGGLAVRGVAPGEIVASWSPNAIEPLVVHYAAIVSGVAVVHLDPDWDAAQASSHLGGARAVGLFVRAFHQGIQYPARVKTLRREQPQLQFVVTHGREPRFESLLPGGWTEFLHSGAAAQAPEMPPAPAPSATPEHAHESAQRIGMVAGLHVDGTLALGPLVAHLHGHTLVIGDADEADP